ncbi:inorganic phosphate transporter, PiT family [Dethiosulfatibacter aminovorans DSM 17477]|uniref:Inorganic phosphate transporter, PiT family n=1 Tax=Dethiosulfatibacter aminovorans DSM 17477 TaxID=1121476 RepID=A0A1M6LYC6_9FIRM|nr:inorganic phosphate transporter [Dethiosulfatibacter aminovorans]SHJ76165.1 inorganic phosphate transporter, PiT family [Dethiosulfatibacter aminovorans DSM 17477]
MVIGINIVLTVLIIIALIFTLTNGLHDASSVVATFISCRAAKPRQAVLLASVFGLIGVLLSGNQVADTVSAIISIAPNEKLLYILIASILGAVTWNIITWSKGLPSSSSHALIGGLVGATWVSNGSDSILWGGAELLSSSHQLVGIIKVVAALIFSPLFGYAAAYIIQKIAFLLLRNSKSSINTSINRLQWIGAAVLAFSHGANDSQKITGLISLAFISSGVANITSIPFPLKFAVGSVMFLGTAFGGWRIMKTLGREIYDLKPIHSLNSMISSGTSILLATFAGAPVSTTHVVVGSIMGVGAADEYKMVNWNIGKEIVISWFITIPSAAVCSATIYALIEWRFLL